MEEKRPCNPLVWNSWPAQGGERGGGMGEEEEEGGSEEGRKGGRGRRRKEEREILSPTRKQTAVVTDVGDADYSKAVNI